MTTLSEMGAALEVAVGVWRRVKRECPVDHRPQSMECDRAVHRLEIGAAADADRSEGHAVPAQQ
jgi:hypothetical protein